MSVQEALNDRDQVRPYLFGKLAAVDVRQISLHLRLILVQYGPLPYSG